MPYDIDFEAVNHLEHVKTKVYEEFAKRTDNHIAELSSKDGVLAKQYEQRMNYTTLFFKLMDEQYVGLLYDTVEQIKQLFTKHGIQFRLYDMTYVQHAYHRASLIWFVRDMEYVFDFMFDSDQVDPIDSFYRVVLTNGTGLVINGDSLTGTINTFDSAEPKLPDWFVTGLRHNS